MQFFLFLLLNFFLNANASVVEKCGEYEVEGWFEKISDPNLIKQSRSEVVLRADKDTISETQFFIQPLKSIKILPTSYGAVKALIKVSKGCTFRCSVELLNISSLPANTVPRQFLVAGLRPIKPLPCP